MLLLLSVVIVLLGLTYTLTLGLRPSIKVWVRALMTLMVLGPTAYLAFNIRDDAMPGSMEVTADEMQKAASAAPR
jgi:hypothetical protein